MPLPRNKLAKGDNLRTRFGPSKLINNNETSFKILCDKHGVKPFEFRAAKLIDQFGKVTFLEHTEIRSNMKASIMTIKYDMSDTQKEGIYDLFQLAYDKKVKDQHKQADDIKSAIKNFGIDKEEGDPVEQMRSLDVLGSDTLSGKEATSSTESDTFSGAEAESVTVLESTPESITVPESTPIKEVKTSDKQTDPDKLPNKKKEKQRLEIKEKREKALKQLRSDMEKKATDTNRNKFHRNFMADLHSRFGEKIVEMPDFKFVELRKNSTDMVIEHADIYKINLGTKETYLLVVGDLNMKRDVARKIDPGFESEKIHDEYEDFLNRIKAKEATKISMSDADILEDNFDNPEDLDMEDSDDEDVPALVEEKLDGKIEFPFGEKGERLLE
jgi:hypothetical protein